MEMCAKNQFFHLLGFGEAVTLLPEPFWSLLK